MSILHGAYSNYGYVTSGPSSLTVVDERNPALKLLIVAPAAAT
ncbi:hypothetical protein PC110_g21456, partial [Phytophthora cactorum]